MAQLHVNNVTGTDAAFFGSEGSPYLTMAYAAGVAVPGDAILVQNSGTTYTETFLITTKSGTAGNEITLRPQSFSNPPTMAPTSPLRWRGVDYWIIEGLYFDYGSALDGDGSIIRIGETTTASTMCTNFTIRRCYFYHSSFSGLFLEHCEDVVVEMCHFLDLRRRVASADTGALEMKFVAHRITIRYCVFEDIGSDGIEIEEKDLIGPDTSVIGDITIQYCDFFINRPYGDKPWHDLSGNTADDNNVGENAIDLKDHNIGDGTIIIEYCNIHGFYATVAGQDASGSSGEGISMHNDTAPLTQPAIVRYNMIWDCDQGITLNDNTGGGVGGWFIGNIITDCNVFSLNFIDCADFWVRIEQNTIVNNTGQLRLGGVSTIDTFRNNIIANNGTLLRGTVTEGTFSNNCWYNVGTVPAQWVGSGDVTSDPNLDSRFAPQAGSPVLGAGVNLGHTLDFIGQTRPNPPAIGAYEAIPALASNIVISDDLRHRWRERVTLTDTDSSLWISPQGGELVAGNPWSVRIGMDNANGRYWTWTYASTKRFRVWFVIDPDSMAMANNDDFGTVSFLNGGSTEATARLNFNSANYGIVIRMSGDTGTLYASDAFGDVIADDITEIEIDLRWADSPGANNGHILLYINGSLVASNTGLDNDLGATDSLAYGARGGIDAGTIDPENYYYLGPIIANNDGEPINAGFGVSLALAIASTSTTPDDVAAGYVYSFALAVASQSTTPDDAGLFNGHAIALAAGSQSTTPDDILLALGHEIALATASQSTAPDTVSLGQGAGVVLSLSIASVSTTPDDAALNIAHALVLAVASTSTTPDDVSIESGYSFALAVASQSTTPDDVTLGQTHSFALAVASQSTTPNDVALSIQTLIILAVASQSTTPNAVNLTNVYQMAMIIMSASTTPAVSIGLVHRLAMAAASGSTTPDDAGLSLVVSNVYLRGDLLGTDQRTLHAVEDR